jgi:regulator of sigma E protease
MTLLWAVILFGILIFFHELGHFLLAKILKVKVLKFSLGMGPKVIGKKIGETEYIISAFPLGGYVKPLGEEPGEEMAEEEKPRAFNFQKPWKRAAIILAGPVFNLVLAYIIFAFFLGIGQPIAIPDLDSITTTIEGVQENSPAMKAGIKKDDTVIAINEKPVSDWNEMAEVFAKNPSKELAVKIKRGNEISSVSIIPESVTAKDENGKEIAIGRIGISKKLNAHFIESKGIIEMPFKALEALYGWCVLTLKVVVMLFTGGVSAKQMGGPILIVDAAAKAASVGLFAYFNFIAVISVNLAVLNLMPVPVLDGGHLMFLSIEALRRKPLSEKVLTIANKIGMALLIMLITFVFYNDIMRIVVPWVEKSLSQ